MPVLRSPRASATTRGPRAKSSSPRAGASNRGRGRRAAIANPSKRATSATRRAGGRPRKATTRGRDVVRSGSRKATTGAVGKRGARGQVRSVAKSGRTNPGRANRAGRPKATRPSSTLGRQGTARGTGAATRGSKAGTVKGIGGRMAQANASPRRATRSNDVRSGGRGGQTRRHEDERYRGGPVITGTGEIADRGQFPRDEEERLETERRNRDSPRWQEEGISASVHGEGAGVRGFEPGTRLKHKQAGMQDLGRPQAEDSERAGKAAGHPYPQEEGDRFGGGYGQKRGKRNTGEEE